jgi:antitoxin (DNA-binding transcriptional repressor) of toxin-antitoxin stability system
MQTLTAREFQKNFGAITDQVLSGELFTVTKYGRPAYFVIPNNSDSEEAIRHIAGRRLVNNLKNSKATEAAKALTFDDITKLINDAD